MNGLPPPGMLPPNAQNPYGQQQMPPQGPVNGAPPLPVNQPAMTPPPGVEPPVPPEVFDLTLGKYDLVVQAGPSYTTRREETAAALTDAVRSYPQAASALLPVLLDTLDIPGVDKIKARLDQLAQQGPNSPEMQKQAQEMQQMQAENLQLKNENALMKAQAAADKQISAMKEQVAQGQVALEKQQGEAKHALQTAMSGIEQQKMAIEQQNADTNRMKADAALISAKTAAAPLGVTSTSVTPDMPQLMAAAIKEALSLMPPLQVQMPRTKRTMVRDPKTGLALHAIDEPMDDTQPTGPVN